MTDKKGFWTVVLGKARKQEEDRKKKELEKRKRIVMEFFRERDGLTKLDIYRMVRKRKPESYDSLSDYHSPGYEKAVNDLAWREGYLVKIGGAYWLSEKGREHLGIKHDPEEEESSIFEPSNYSPDKHMSNTNRLRTLRMKA